MTTMPPWRPEEEPRPRSRRNPDQELRPARPPTPSGEAELGTDGPGAIVVGVDGTPTSLRAVAYPAGLARRQGGRLIAVYVRKPLRTPVALSGWVDAGIVAAEADAQKDMEDEVWTQIASDVAAWGCGARVVIRNGNPLAELRKIAVQSGADQIIVGASSGLAHRLFGSLGHRLLRCKPCPVTIVP